MSKNLCKLEHKWCKFCKKEQHCSFCNATEPESIKTFRVCPKRASVATQSFKSIVKKCDFENVMNIIGEFWEKQKKCREGYKNLYDTLLKMKPTCSNVFIECYYEYFEYESKGCIFAHGIERGKSWGLGFVPWSEWLGMNIMQETLDTFSPDEIVAACFYEMTFYGFEEKKIKSVIDKMNNDYEELKNEASNE